VQLVASQLFEQPLLPLSRYGLISPGAEDFEPTVSAGQALQALGTSTRLTTPYRFTERLPLSGEEVLGTYLYAYVWVPLKLLVPLAALVVAVRMFSDPNSGSTTQTLIIGVLLLVWLGYVLFVLSTLLRRSRGGVG
jgi:hypothetical protein